MMMQKQHFSKEIIERWRYLVVVGLLVAIMLFFIIRLFDLQIVKGSSYLARAENNRTTTVNISTQRGTILDRNGFVLARNVGSYNVTITPAYLPGDEGAKQEVFRRLSELIDIPVSTGVINEITVKTFRPCDNEFGIVEIVYIADTNAPYEPVQVICNIDQKLAMVILEKGADLPGVNVETIAVRDYPTGRLTAEIIGFLGPIPAVSESYYRALGFVPNRDKVGYAGIELQMDDVLRGRNGNRTAEIDSAGQTIRDLIEPQDPEPGLTVKLTIDTRLQQLAKEALIQEMAKWNDPAKNRLGVNMELTNGVVIAMNPKTGEILALVSEPTYENNRMARQIPTYYYNQLKRDPAQPLFNQAISAELPPGSVFKMSAAIGILTEEVVTPEYQIEDPGAIFLEEKYSPNEPGVLREYVCYTYKSTGKGHGMVNFLRGVALSCDVYFYKVGGGYKNEVPEGLGIWRLGEYARALGYGNQTGIELPGEAKGLIPNPNWKRINLGENWATGDTYIATIGQGYVLATPLQVLVSVATLANDGKMMQPTIIKEVLDADGNVVKPFSPTLKWDITQEKLITVYDENNFPTEEKISVPKWVVDLTKKGMREVVVNGTATDIFADFKIQTAGKTGTAEYCDNVAQAKNRCRPGQWPAHAWYVGYAPYDNPEIVVVAFVYNGNEGSTVAAPIVRKVMEGYFELKAIDAENLP
jgi:penicillin-binding protein 2